MTARVRERARMLAITKICCGARVQWERGAAVAFCASCERTYDMATHNQVATRKWATDDGGGTFYRTKGA